jgi:hypothetical protein
LLGPGAIKTRCGADFTLMFVAKDNTPSTRLRQ